MLTAEQRACKARVKADAEAVMTCFETQESIEAACNLLKSLYGCTSADGAVLDRVAAQIIYSLAALGLCLILERRDMKAGA